MALPSAFRHTALNVGSTIPKLSFSVRSVSCLRDAHLHVVNALYIRQVGTRAQVGQPAILTDGLESEDPECRSANGLALG